MRIESISGEHDVGSPRFRTTRFDDRSRGFAPSLDCFGGPFRAEVSVSGIRSVQVGHSPRAAGSEGCRMGGCLREIDR